MSQKLAGSMQLWAVGVLFAEVGMGVASAVWVKWWRPVCYLHIILLLMPGRLFFKAARDKE